MGRPATAPGPAAVPALAHCPWSALSFVSQHHWAPFAHDMQLVLQLPQLLAEPRASEGGQPAADSEEQPARGRVAGDQGRGGLYPPSPDSQLQVEASASLGADLLLFLAQQQMVNCFKEVAAVLQAQGVLGLHMAGQAVDPDQASLLLQHVFDAQGSDPGHLPSHHRTQAMVFSPQTLLQAAHDLGIGSSTAQPPSGPGLPVLRAAGAAAGGSPLSTRPLSRLSLQWASSVSQSSYTSTLVQPLGSGGEGSNTTQTTPSPPRPWLPQRLEGLLTPGQLVTPSEPTPLNSPGSAYEALG
ncbi:hypothetical protein HaLaN_02747 [Haematococcus lacustris]|uniref:Uncharacterized protein n=1 Tax=Haematococcus lacustris TaxID=44745 RepID=A0A699YP22_HAELA|nr:hypothetical protein HaLaN_02747 [Haematococcus lacustris]